MRILLTGATGFLGAEILAELMKRQEILAVAWGRDRKRIEALQIRFAVHSPRLVIEAQDLRESPLLPPNVDTIIHGAALRSLAAGQDPAELTRVNVEGTRHIVRLAEQSDCRQILYVSTQSVYGSEGAPWAEDALPRPETPYGTSKRDGESEVLHSVGIGVAILRMSRLYGVTPFTRWNELPGRFARAVSRGESLKAHGIGEQRLDLLHVYDAARAVVLAALAPSQRRSRIYNIGAGGSVSLNEICEIFSALAIKHKMPEVDICRDPEHPAGRCRHIELDVSRIRADLGWVPRVSLVEGLSDYLSYISEER